MNIKIQKLNLYKNSIWHYQFEMKDKFIFASLDVDTKAQALEFVQKSKNYVQAYKIGPRLFLKYGAKLIEDIKELGDSQIFLDFKFYDIPSSTVEAVRSAFQIGADYATVHAGVGLPTLKSLSEFELEARQKRFFQILCVTVLSSKEPDEDHQNQVLELADIVDQAGLQGLVCSPYELEYLRPKYPDMFLLTPGIRLHGESHDDQKRVMSPQEAFKAGSSAIVMGRSLLRAKNLEQMLQSLFLK